PIPSIDGATVGEPCRTRSYRRAGEAAIACLERDRRIAIEMRQARCHRRYTDASAVPHGYEMNGECRDGTRGKRPRPHSQPELPWLIRSSHSMYRIHSNLVDVACVEHGGE